MKKILLAIATVMVGISASAISFSVANRTPILTGEGSDMFMIDNQDQVMTEDAILSRATSSDDEMYYSLANNLSTSLDLIGAKAGMQVAMACQIDPSFLSNIVDGEITGITFYTGSDASTRRNEIKKGWVFITDDLTGDFLYTQEVELPSSHYTRVNVPLTTPFVIPEGKKIFFGVYETIVGATNKPLVIDYYTQHLNDYGGWAAFRNSDTGKWQWDNVSSEFGFLMVGATIKAKSLPTNMVSVLEIASQPVAYENEEFLVQFKLQNNGANNIRFISMEYGIEDEELTAEDFTLNMGWSFNQVIVGSVLIKATNPAKATNLIINVKEIDGEANNDEHASGSCPIVIVPEDKGYKRNIVVEEFTSISCPSCPIGYTTMEKIRKEFPDGNVIPVCVHVNVPGSDPMTASSFNSLFNKYSKAGVPSSAVNRQYQVYPYYDDLIGYINGLLSLPAIGQVSAKAKLDPATRILTIDTETAFTFDYTDGDKDFILAYAVTEDNVGPYSQQNGYSGLQNSYAEEWTNQPSIVQLVYNDVARQLDKYTGITGSIPAEITAGETYKFSHDLKLLNAIEDFNRIHVIVYLINRKTGAIENACTLTGDGNGNYAGIESVVVDNDEDAPAEYYNLQGVRVKNPANGVYIRRQGNKVSKVLLH